MISINELTIGSHVLYGGERVEIEEIDALRELIGLKGHYVDNCGVRYHRYYRVQDLSPIPITEELLEELGFEKCHRTPDGFEVAYDYIDKESYTLMEVAKCKNIPEWRVLCVGGILVRYLHELEAFIQLTCGVNLT